MIDSHRPESRDIVDSLRACAPRHRLYGNAADEIERLRAELIRLRDVVCDEDCEIIDEILGNTLTKDEDL